MSEDFLSQIIVEKDDEIAQLFADVQDKNAELTRLREQLETKDAEIERMGEELDAYLMDGSSAADRIATLSAENERLRKALEASDKLITDAQEKLCAYLHPDSGIDDRQIANEMLEHFDGPRQREVQKQTREALAAHVGEGEKDGLE